MDTFEKIVLVIVVIQAVWNLIQRVRGKATSEDLEDPVPIKRAKEKPQEEELRGWLGRATDQVDDALRESEVFLERARLLEDELRRGDGPLSILRESLIATVEQPLQAAHAVLRDTRVHLETGDAEMALRFMNDLGPVRKAFEQLGEVPARLGAIEALARWRTDPQLAPIMADADAIAEAFIDPFRKFTRNHGIYFARQRSICAPAAAGMERVYVDLLPGHPVIFVPDDFGEDLLRWPSVAHEIGHVLWNTLPGFAEEVRDFAVSRNTAWLPRLQGRDVVFDVHAAFHAWLPEIVPDVICTMLLGPSALAGMVHSFGATSDPREVQMAYTDDGQTLSVHPPRHLRIVLCAHVLDLMGYTSDVDDLLQRWDRQHHAPTTLLFPTLYGQLLELPAPRFMALGRALVQRFYASDYEALAGYPLSAVHDLAMSPGKWARAKARAGDLIADKPFHDEARIVIAAGIIAAERSPGAQVRITRGVRRAIVGMGVPKKHLADAHYRTRPLQSASGVEMADAVAALILHEVLHRKHARVPRSRMAARDPLHV